MQAKPVVISIYEFCQLLMQGVEVVVSSRIDLFTLERPQKALTSGIVINAAMTFPGEIVVHFFNFVTR